MIRTIQLIGIQLILFWFAFAWTSNAVAADAPALGLVTTITGGNPYAAVDDVISYQYVVTNSGNVVLAGPVTVADDQATDESCPAVTTVGNLDANLDPGEAVTCTGSHTVVQADLDAGSVTANATACADGVSSNVYVFERIGFRAFG